MRVFGILFFVAFSCFGKPLSHELRALGIEALLSRIEKLRTLTSEESVTALTDDVLLHIRSREKLHPELSDDSVRNVYRVRGLNILEAHERAVLSLLRQRVLEELGVRDQQKVTIVVSEPKQSTGGLQWLLWWRNHSKERPTKEVVLDLSDGGPIALAMTRLLQKRYLDGGESVSFTIEMLAAVMEYHSIKEQLTTLQKIPRPGRKVQGRIAALETRMEALLVRYDFPKGETLSLWRGEGYRERSKLCCKAGAGLSLTNRCNRCPTAYRQFAMSKKLHGLSLCKQVITVGEMPEGLAYEFGVLP